MGKFQVDIWIWLVFLNSEKLLEAVGVAWLFAYLQLRACYPMQVSWGRKHRTFLLELGRRTDSSPQGLNRIAQRPSSAWKGNMVPWKWKIEIHWRGPFSKRAPRVGGSTRWHRRKLTSVTTKPEQWGWWNPSIMKTNRNLVFQAEKFSSWIK